MDEHTAWSIYGGFASLFVVLILIVIKVVSWEGSVAKLIGDLEKKTTDNAEKTKNRIDKTEAAIHHVSDKMIAIETICSKCPIEQVESCQAVLKSRVTVLETNYQNVAQNIRDIKELLGQLNRKLDNIGNSKSTPEIMA